ncbi:MAG: AmmeMemoRadiSam system protein B [Candidatus Peregrinibacteria bacterium]
MRLVVYRSATILTLILICSGCASKAPAPAANPETDFRPVYQSFFTGKSTYDHFYENAGNSDPLTERIAGGIVSHHLLVGNAFARFYQALRTQTPSTVVIIGPNHFEQGKGAILTADGRYDTPYGSVPIDGALVQSLVASRLVSLDREPFIREHSISAEVAFIARTWPKATIVPIILKMNVTQEESEKLGSLLSTILPQDALVLASVDFSHYQPEIVADFHDQTSLAAIRSFDLPRVMKLEIDSPASIATLLTYHRERGAQKILYSEHTNSASFTGHPEIPETTSHFFLAFGQGPAVHPMSISTLFMGDAIFGRGIEGRFRTEKTHLLDALAGNEDRFLQGNDLSILNLEGPITTAPAAKNALVHFAFKESIALPLLKRLHVTAVFTANNHWMDSGETGTHETLSALQTLHIAAIGNPSPCIEKTIDRATIGLCAFDDTNDRLDEDSALKTVQSERAAVDRLIVSLHWGKEGESQPTERQRRMAHTFIDAGADAIIGHHPHVVQPLEIYHGAPILYSLGNLLFDQEDPALSSGLAAGLVFHENETVLYLYPLHTTSGIPQMFNADERKEFFARYLKSSGDFKTDSLEGKLLSPRNGQ